MWWLCPKAWESCGQANTEDKYQIQDLDSHYRCALCLAAFEPDAHKSQADAGSRYIRQLVEKVGLALISGNDSVIEHH